MTQPSKVTIIGGPAGEPVRRRIARLTPNAIVLEVALGGGEFYFSWTGMLISGPESFAGARIDVSDRIALERFRPAGAAEPPKPEEPEPVAPPPEPLREVAPEPPAPEPLAPVPTPEENPPIPLPAVAYADDVTAYSPIGAYAAGEKIRHSKFGLGTVEKSLDSRIVVLFGIGRKTLAQSPGRGKCGRCGGESHNIRTCGNLQRGAR